MQGRAEGSQDVVLCTRCCEALFGRVEVDGRTVFDNKSYSAGRVDLLAHT